MIEPLSDRWQERLQAVASRTAYPKTPDLWPSVELRLTRAKPASAAPRLRWAALVAAGALALLAALVASPQARAALFQVLRVGSVRIFVEPSRPAPTLSTPSATATIAPTPVLRPPLDLRGGTTLEGAQESLGLPLPLPTYPPGLGDPDLVFVQDLDGPLAILVWLDTQDPTRARLALTILGPHTFAGKSQTRVIQETKVNGADAVWLEGTHLLWLRSGRMDFRSLVTGNVLVWSEGGITYRLETDQPLEEAVRIAESLKGAGPSPTGAVR